MFGRERRHYERYNRFHADWKSCEFSAVLDMKSLQEFGEWLEAEGLQAIATRVSTGDECSIIIEDGYVVGQKTPEEPEKKEWKAGTF